MTYRKFKADYLFTGVDMAAPDSVLITTADGRVKAVISASDAGDDVAVFPGLLSPGFVNCHCHLELSHLRGVIPEGTGLIDFLTAIIRQRNKPAGQEAIFLAIETGGQEMLEGGIVAVGDVCNTANTLEEKRKGRLYYHNFIETIGFDETSASERWAHSLAVYDRLGAVGSIVPHAPYSVSPALFRLIAGYPANRLLTIHNQESEEENLFMRSAEGDFQRLFRQLGLDISSFKGYGKRSLGIWPSHFHKHQTVIAVHNVATSEADLGGWTEDGPALHFCLCPRANLYISGRLPDVDALIRKDCRIVIGTDSLASNHGLSVLEEIKTLQRAFPRLDTPRLLQWATLNGAKALQVDDIFGSFEPGRRPGVLLLQHSEDGSLKDATVRRLL